jgi:uncharacterized protein (DUF1800 family)
VLWLDRVLRSRWQLVEKMTLFWHNHFATGVSKSPTEMMAQQNALVRAQGLGNFRTLLASVTRDPAMLVWLDNRFNTKAHPNENGNLEFATDFRAVYATVIARWLGRNPSDVIDGDFAPLTFV